MGSGANGRGSNGGARMGEHGDEQADLPPAQQNSEESERADRLERLITEWLTVPELAQMQNVKLSEVRRQIKDRELLAVRRGPNAATYVPAAFLLDGAPHPRLRGTFTVLRDGGMNDAEAVEWLFTPDRTLPAGDSPMEAFRAGFVTEVRRRAMETAF